jgi:hypothetical protein
MKYFILLLLFCQITYAQDSTANSYINELKELTKQTTIPTPIPTPKPTQTQRPTTIVKVKEEVKPIEVKNEEVKIKKTKRKDEKNPLIKIIAILLITIPSIRMAKRINDIN